MYRTNSPQDVATTGVVQVDAGEGIRFALPTDNSGGESGPASPHTHDIEDIEGLRDELDIAAKGTWDDPIDLGTAHLDTITTPGYYTQIFASRATKAQGYPHNDEAGVLEVKTWNKASGYTIAIYTPWRAAQMAKRTLYSSGWQTWYGVNGTAIT